MPIETHLPKQPGEFKQPVRKGAGKKTRSNKQKKGEERIRQKMQKLEMRSAFQLKGLNFSLLAAGSAGGTPSLPRTPLPGCRYAPSQAAPLDPVCTTCSRSTMRLARGTAQPKLRSHAAWDP